MIIAWLVKSSKPLVRIEELYLDKPRGIPRQRNFWLCQGGKFRWSTDPSPRGSVDPADNHARPRGPVAGAWTLNNLLKVVDIVRRINLRRLCVKDGKGPMSELCQRIPQGLLLLVCQYRHYPLGHWPLGGSGKCFAALFRNLYPYLVTPFEVFHPLDQAVFFHTCQLLRNAVRLQYRLSGYGGGCSIRSLSQYR